MRRRHRKTWIDTLDRSLLDAVKAAVDARIRSVADIYVEYKLGKFTSLHAFRRFATKRRLLVKRAGARGRAAATLLVGFALPAELAARHGYRPSGRCIQCGQAAAGVVIYAGERRVTPYCGDCFEDFAGGLLAAYRERGSGK